MRVSAYGNISCDCGKVIARVQDGKIYVWCRGKECKKGISIGEILGGGKDCTASVARILERADLAGCAAISTDTQ